MTFTSIPPSLRPVVEDVYEKMNSGPYTWESDATEIEQLIIAFLNACVERGVGKHAALEYGGARTNASNPDALILNLGATDDTA